MLIALLIVAITLRLSREQTQAGEQRKREHEKMRVMKDAGEQAESGESTPFSLDMAPRGLVQGQAEALPDGRLPPAGLRRAHQRHIL